MSGRMVSLPNYLDQITISPKSFSQLLHLHQQTNHFDDLAICESSCAIEIVARISANRARIHSRGNGVTRQSGTTERKY
jgi:hypothetical protein